MKRHRRIGAAGIIVAAAGVFAGPCAVGAPTGASTQPDTSVCVACHGIHGEGAANGVPRLAGQNADYMNHALSMFKDGTRASAIMQPIARTLDDAEIRRLADYFSNQAAPIAEPPAPASLQLAIAGKQLAEVGAPNVAACFSCHGAQGKGVGARFPGIASQPAQFTIDRLHEFQERARGKTPDPGTMTAVSTTLNEEQVEEAAAYLSRLQP
jgi:cytochrome c553